MPNERLIEEKKLAGLAKKYRLQAKITKAEAARQLGVTKGTIHQAEEYPDVSLTKIRIRMIEAYSSFIVCGPLYELVDKKSCKRKGYGI